MNELEMTINEYKERRQNAYADLGDRLGYMMNELQQMKEKVDWAKVVNKRINLDTHNIAMLASTMMMMNNAASEIAKCNEVLMALGDTK